MGLNWNNRYQFKPFGHTGVTIGKIPVKTIEPNGPADTIENQRYNTGESTS